MGEKTWPVHRWVICEQSKYFEKALEGKFKVRVANLSFRLKNLLTDACAPQESNSKTIDLTGSQFSEQQVDMMLKYLYTKELDPLQKKKPIKTFLVADYFQVTALRDKAAEELSTHLNSLKLKKSTPDFSKCCCIVLGRHPGTHLEKIVVKAIADNIDWVMHESGVWDDLTSDFLGLAKKVLEVIYPSPEARTVTKRPAGVAFDDTLQPARAKKGPGYRPGRVSID